MHWAPSLQPDFIQELADSTVGYCGADLKALCTEATLNSLRHHYPQIYDTSDKLLIDVSAINVSPSDFHAALSTIIPTTQRSNITVAKDLSCTVFPLLAHQLEAILNILVHMFPVSCKSISKTLPGLKKRIKQEQDKRDKIKLAIHKNGAIDDKNPSKDLSASFISSVAFSFQSQDLSVQIGNAFLEICESDNTDKPIDISDAHALPSVHRPCLLIAGLPGLVFLNTT